MQAILSEILPIPVEAGRPLSNVNTSRMKQADRRGCLSEWAVAFGLGLKRTHGYFGSRDGKRRDPSAPASDSQTSAVEVIDLGQAMERTKAAGDTSRPPVAARSTRVREAAHA